MICRAKGTNTFAKRKYLRYAAMLYILMRLAYLYYLAALLMYAFVKIWVRTGLQFYCGKIEFDTKHMYQGNQPLILACTHPNSFFDALVMGAYHPREMHFLARGDAFKNPRAAKVLRLLNMIPIYRLSEGKENLDNNSQTFDECNRVFKKGGMVLIFSEGLCINEWRLRPLKKGTARLAYMCWEEHGVTDMLIQPLGLNYNSFTAVPKRVFVEYGPVVQRDGFDTSSPATFYNEFNNVLTARLEPLVLQPTDSRLQKQQSNTATKALLALPALVGWVLHKPFFLAWRKFIQGKTKNSVFFDSILFGSLLIVYPLLVLLITITAVAITQQPLYTLLFVLLPFTAWSYKQYKS